MLGGPIIQAPLILYRKQGLLQPGPQATPLGVGFYALGPMAFAVNFKVGGNLLLRVRGILHLHT
jgi:hypothetical protein